jgi:hypothetical protein
MRKGMGVAAAVIVVFAFGPTSANAAVKIGFTESSNTACGAPSTVDFQTLSTPGITYSVPSAGVVTSWQHQARQIAGALLKLKVGRPLSALAGPASFLAVGESAFENVSQAQSYNFLTRIPVQAGDRIGLATAGNAAGSPPACNTGTSTLADEVYEGGDFAVGTTATLNPFNNFRLNISAVVEPDADGDGYGDETQDQCATDASTQSTCPTKKCKKKKGKGKKGSAETAKKKKKGCKKKGKKKN